MPPVAILIVNYRTYDELDSCLSSIARHEPDADITVVDHEANEALGRAMATAYPRVHYLPSRSNPGFGAGVNLAARRTTAPLLLLVNPDVELGGPASGPLADCLRRHPTVGIVGGRLREADGSLQLTARAFPDLTTAFGGRTSWLTRVAPNNPLARRNLGDSAASDATVVDWVAGAFMLVRRD
ncbi:MAG: glycosyltransferase, partial [Acidobacteriota bacterium]|nr:glycosyltransferase [Acidobacteriota bacterium]